MPAIVKNLYDYYELMAARTNPCGDSAASVKIVQKNLQDTGLA